MPEETLARYRAFAQAETDSAALYVALAEVTRDPNVAGVYRRMAEMEGQHRDVWLRHLREGGEANPTFVPGRRARLLMWLARHFGAETVVPLMATLERNATEEYASDPLAVQAAMPQQERLHARIFSAMQRGAPVSGPALAQLEGRHRTGGGNALRAAVLGASDGLTSNMSLVMGVAGANLSGHAILLTGFAGLLAGSCSMAIGEWLSVQSARELYGRQIDVERAELAESPDDEREELALIYQAKGIAPDVAAQMAERIIGQHDVALDTLAREELGIDPTELGGSAYVAAGTSFLLFAAGAIIPVLPFLFGSGLGIIAFSMILSVVGLSVIGLGVSLTTGVSLWKSCGRQIALGVLAAAVTFGAGKLIGHAVG